MRAFRFRLERVERWRRLGAKERQREHERDARRMLEAADAASAHAEGSRRLLAEIAEGRARDSVDIGVLRAEESARTALAVAARALDARHADARRRAEASRARLVEARRDLKALEGLRRLRFNAWRSGSEREAQKLADEAHRARWIRARDEEASQATNTQPGDRP